MVKIKYKEMMPNTVTRMIQYVCEESKSLIMLRVIFLTMVSEETATIPIIIGQLKRHHDNPLAVEKLRYFQQHLLPFLRIAVDTLLNYSFYHDNILWAHAAFVSRVQMAWNSMSVSVCAITIEYDKTQKAELAKAASATRAKKAPKKPRNTEKKKKKKPVPKSAFIGNVTKR
jgi:hypothetical protein